MKLKNPLNVFKAIKEKAIKETLANATDSAINYLNSLDLDKDGVADVEEIKIFLKDIQTGIENAADSVNGKQIVKTVEAVEALVAAGQKLGEVSKEVLDTEQAKAAQKQLTNAIKLMAQYIKDVAEATTKTAS